MTVDVVTEIEIRRPRDEVAAYASEPGNATAWYQEHQGGAMGDVPAARRG